MKNYVPWKWIITSFSLAIFGLVAFGLLCSDNHRGNDTRLRDLQDTINEKKEYITNLRDTLEQKDKDILKLQQALEKKVPEPSPTLIDKGTINALNEKLKEKERIIRNKDSEIKRLKDKIDFINSL